MLDVIRRFTLLALLTGILTAHAATPPAPAPLDPARFSAAIDHPYFPLVPGTVLTYVEKLGRHRSDIEVTVTSEPRIVAGIACTVVRERVHEKGAFTQESLAGYAQHRDGAVWIVFEDSREYRGKDLISTEGSWEAGVDGAQAGVIMPASLTPGPEFRHGFLAGIAEDRGQLVTARDSVTVPHGAFGDCLKFKEWSMLESGTDRKWYARGVGLVRAESAARELTELVSVRRP